MGRRGPAASGAGGEPLGDLALGGGRGGLSLRAAVPPFRHFHS